MKYRQVGNSGLRISELGLGSWITFGVSVDQEKTNECFRKAYELGINFFDTANVYGQGVAEKALSIALRGYHRETYVLATKVFFPMGDGPNERGLSRKHIMEQCHASLKRLNTQYIDLYQCHRYDPTVPLEETLRALEDLIVQGKVLYAGVSEWNASQIAAAIKVSEKFLFHRLISNQPRYNMFQRGIEEEILPFCEKEGIGQLVFSPLAQGFLTGKYRSGQPLPEGSRATTQEGKGYIERFFTEQNLVKVEELLKLSQEEGIPLSQMALAWVLRLPGISSAIIGASKPEQIAENIKALEITLSEDLLVRIEKILRK